MLPDFFYVLLSQKSSEYACCMFYTHFEKEKIGHATVSLCIHGDAIFCILFYFVSILGFF